MRRRACKLFACSLAAGCLGDPEPALQRGTFTSQRPEVGALEIADGGSCTATLVGDQMTLLTAGHCVPDEVRAGAGTYPVRGAFLVDPEEGGDPVGFPLDEAMVFGRSGDNDLALVRLRTPVPIDLAYAVRIAARAPSPGQRATLFGYGCSARGADDFGLKRCWEWTVGQPSAALCHGDSGGPAIVSGEVSLVASAYYAGPRGRDLFVTVAVHHDRLVAQIAAWSEPPRPR